MTTLLYKSRFKKHPAANVRVKVTRVDRHTYEINASAFGRMRLLIATAFYTVGSSAEERRSNLNRCLLQLFAQWQHDNRFTGMGQRN